MFRNYLVTALRNIARHQLHSFINIAGLAVGLACVIFVLMFIRDELSYDRWVPGTDNLYRIEKTSHLLGRDPANWAQVPFPMAAVMRNGIPEVTAATHIYYTFMTLFAGDRQFREHIAAVDPNFFQVIKLPLMKGDTASVFRDPESVVVSESAARKYFGTTEAIGKFIRTTADCEVTDAQCLGRLVPLKVTGVLRDIPHNSHLDGDVFIPTTSITDRIGPRGQQSWNANCCFTYVRLIPGARPETVLTKLAPLLDRAFPPEPEGDRRKASQRFTFYLTPFTDVHLTSGRWSGNEKPPGSRTTLYGMGVVGLLILFVACFNFMNLATAQASLRAREIALRKTHGANRRQLIVQFLGEAVLTALLALLVALALVEILRPAFGRLLQHPIAIHYDGVWLLLLAVIAVVAGLLSGAYPALVLSGFRPSAILRSRQFGASRFGAPAKRSGGPAIRRIHRPGHRRHGRVQPDQLCAQHRSGYPQGQSAGGLRQRVTESRRPRRLRPETQVQSRNPRRGHDRSGSLRVLRYRIDHGWLPGHSDVVALNMLTIGAGTPQFLGMRLVAGRLLSDTRALDRYDHRPTGHERGLQCSHRHDGGGEHGLHAAAGDRQDHHSWQEPCAHRWRPRQCQIRGRAGAGEADHLCL